MAIYQTQSVNIAAVMVNTKWIPAGQIRPFDTSRFGYCRQE